MVAVLVFGANGYIGFEVARTLADRGHVVYGLVRDDKHSKRLRAEEIIPVVGDVNDIVKLTDTISKVAVVIDTTPYFTPAAAETVQVNVNIIARIAKQANTTIRYVFTTGVLVYGDRNGATVDESIGLAPTTFRADQETIIRTASAKTDGAVDGVVIRPGYVYGKSHDKFLHHMFSGSTDGSIEIRGKPDKYWSWIHVTDLANAYALVAEAAPALVRNEVFNVTDSTRSTYEEIAVALSRANGIKGAVKRLPVGEDPMSQISNVSAIVSSNKISRFLGWQPRHGPLLEAGHPERLIAAFHAHKV